MEILRKGKKIGEIKRYEKSFSAYLLNHPTITIEEMDLINRYSGVMNELEMLNKLAVKLKFKLTDMQDLQPAILKES